MSWNTNGQYSHPENVLVGMMASVNVEDRKKAIGTVFQVRERGPQLWSTPSGQRPFKPDHYKVNPGATSLLNLNMIPLEQCATEPPVTLSFTAKELMDIESVPLKLDLQLGSVAVERAVKLTTAASKVCADPVEQDGLSLQAVSARKRNPLKFMNKIKKT